MQADDRSQKKLATQINQLIRQGKPKESFELLGRFDGLISNSQLLLEAGKSCYFHGDLEQAIKYLQKANQAKANNAETRKMLWSACRDSRNYEAMLHFTEEMSKNILSASELLMVFRAYLGVCDWCKARQYQQQAIESGKNGEIPSTVLGGLLIETCTLPNIDQATVRDLHIQYGDALLESKKNDMPASYPAEKNLGGRMKIAYISADFNFHPVGCFIDQIISSHLRDQFEVYCYAHLIRQDEITSHIRNNVDHFIDITAISDANLAVRIHADGIHIAIDLGGLTTNSRIAALAHRPAPVQITYLGYPNTTGLSTVDYRITDPYADENSDDFYSEKLIRMPQSFICYGFDTTMHHADTAPSEKNGFITFASFNHVRKLNPEVIETWCEILKQVPGSRLMLKARDLSDALISRNIIGEFARHGISEDRLHVQGYTERYEDNFKMYNEVDIALDTFPYNGTTTTCDAISIGVPVLTLVGESHAQRVSYSILKNIGFEDGITFSRQAYIEKAVQLSRNPKALSTLRRCLMTLFKHSILRQPRLFTRQLETLLSTTWVDKTGLPLPAAVQPITEKDIASGVHSSLPITIAGDVQIVVPNNMELMTPYILTEQQDWFEDEIKFVRKLIKPGMNALDIGANYGCYAITMAKLVGEQGHLWAFEPASDTAAFLAESINANGFKNITLIKAALSNRQGSAELSLDINSELNFITATGDSGQTESVPLMRLDDCIRNYHWHQIDFVKMDAEGEEIHILEGGQDFFNRFSPLIMFELKHAEQINTGLIESFINMGYQTYNLIPGLQLLAPFNPNDNPDAYLLNLFCCKKDTAQRLSDEGFLIMQTMDEPIHANSNWQQLLSEHPYAQELMTEWLSQLESKPLPGWDSYELALNHYASAHTETLKQARLSHLQQSFVHLVSLLDVQITIPRLMSLVRVATELGRRAVADQVLTQMIQHFKQGPVNLLSEPFLAVSQKFEEMGLNTSLEDWSLASVLAAKEMVRAFSSYFIGKSSLPLIEHFLTLGYPDEAMSRRCKLIRQRFQLGEGEISVSKTRKLHIGGKEKHPEWEIFNVNPSELVDHVGNANDLSRFEDNTFEAIYASHVLEHFSYQEELPQVLLEWRRVLKPSGSLYASVPDLDVLCELFLNKDELAPQDHFSVMRMMFGGQLDPYDFHKVGYNAEILAGYLEQAGFENIRVVSDFGLFNDTSSMEFAGKPISLNLLAEKSPVTDKLA